jgi:hypothetical protein
MTTIDAAVSEIEVDDGAGGAIGGQAWPRLGR